jgi:hypothetical protein
MQELAKLKALHGSKVRVLFGEFESDVFLFWVI